MKQYLLFDLDGTLTDSGPGIMHAAQTALDSFGITGLSEQALTVVTSFSLEQRSRLRTLSRQRQSVVVCSM